MSQPTEMNDVQEPAIRIPAGAPERVVLEGRYTRLEPLDPARHSADLFAAIASDAARRHRWLFDLLSRIRGQMHRHYSQVRVVAVRAD